MATAASRARSRRSSRTTRTSKGNETVSQTVNRAKKMLGSSYNPNTKAPSRSRLDQIAGQDFITPENRAAYNASRPITPDRLEKAPVVELPTPTVPVTPGLDLNMANAGLGAGSDGMFEITPIAAQAGDSEGVTAAKDANNVIGSYLEQAMGIAKPVEGASENALAEARRQAGVDRAQQEFNRYSNQINAITARRDADQLGLEGQGRGITDTIIGGQQARIGREAAIQALPIQAQLAAAQGNLEQAQQLMGQLFSAKSADIQADQTYRTNLANSVMSFATSSQQNILQAKQADIAQRAQTAQANLAFQRQLGMQALEFGQNGLISGIASVDPNSPTFEQDMAAFTSQLRKPVAPVKMDTSFDKFGNLINMQTGEVIRATDGGGGIGGGNIVLNDGSMATSDEVAYARQYASTGTIPSGLSSAGVEFGRIAEIAAELPKPPGALVDRNTNVASAGVSAGDQASFDALYNAINTDLPAIQAAWDEMNDTNSFTENAEAIARGEEPTGAGFGTGLLGGIRSKIAPTEAMTRYQTAVADFTAKLVLARSGAAATDAEVARYQALLPGTFNTPLGIGTPGQQKLTALQSQMSAALDDKLSTNGLAIHGYSTVNVGGQDFTVGEVLTDEYGRTGIVNPDGSITVNISN